ELRPYAPREIVEEFASAITREADFGLEAANMQRFARNFAGDPHVHVPIVYESYSAPSVLTMEFIRAHKVRDRAALEAAGIDPRKLAAVGVEFCLKQVFEHHFFHADPHPGNLFVLPGEILVPIDMGMMGTIDAALVHALLELLVGVLLRDADQIVRLFARQGLIAERVDKTRLRRDVADFLDRYPTVPIGQGNVPARVGTLFEILQRHRVRVPSELLLIGKALATIDGMARDLDPTLDPIEAVRPYVLRTWLRRLSDPRFLARDWLELASDTATAVTSFPRDAHAILTDLPRGERALRVRPAGLQPLARGQGA